jgi:hypothetical protein
VWKAHEILLVNYHHEDECNGIESSCIYVSWHSAIWQFLKHNTRSAREYTTFAPAQLLRNWREQRPSNRGDIDSTVTVEIGRVYYTGVDLLLISILYCSTWLLLGCDLNGTPCRILISNVAEIWASKETFLLYNHQQHLNIRQTITNSVWCSARAFPNEYVNEHTLLFVLTTLRTDI